MGIFDKLKSGAEFALDLTAAVARNPLAILSPTKEAAKIKQLRSDISSGDKEKAISYIKTTSTQTALNVGGVLAGAGVLGAAAKTAATNLGATALKAGVIAAPLIVGSSTIRETVGSFSPVAAGVALGEKIESGIKKGEESSTVAAAVIGTAAAGGLGAAAVIGGKYLYNEFKANDNTPEEISNASQNLPTSQSLATIPTNEGTPILPQTQEVTVGQVKRKKRSKVKQMPNNISQKVNLIISQNNNPIKLQKKKYLKTITL